MEQDKRYMRRALLLARLGSQWASPNPLVGAVVVCGGKIIGEGYHKCCGQGHAEVNAIASISPQDRRLLKESTIYVTLEPCSHYGKTPPCAKLIIDSEIPRVVVGVLDPFEKVSGRGIKMLRDAGVEVTVGVCEEECREINRHFFTSVTRATPYVLLKWAESRDGYIGSMDRAVAITSKATNMLSHKLRARFDAIMVGTNTVAVDDCSLTVRGWFGSQPLRVVLDREGRLDRCRKVLSDELPTVVFTQRASAIEGCVEYINIEFDDRLLHNILEELGRRGIRSLMVEGGRELLQSFIDGRLWDEIYRYTSDRDIAAENNLVQAPTIREKAHHTQYIGSDRLDIFLSR